MLQKNGDKYGNNLMDTAKKKGTTFTKTTCKRIVEKSAEATGDLIGNNIADKITSLGNKENETNGPEEFIILQKNREQIINDLRLS